MRVLEKTRLPDPYIPREVYEAFSMGGPGNPTAAALIGTNNRALYVPFQVPSAATLYAVSFVGASATGNYDIGVYNSAFTRLASTGAVAMAPGVQTLSTSLRLVAGDTYYAAFGFSSTVDTIFRWAPGVRGVVAAGLLQEDSAVPLPTTATPVTITETNYPVFALGVRN